MEMTISRASRAAGVGVETIRFYERKGLIRQPPKPTASGFRQYPDATIKRIQFIRQARAIGFSLREIAELLELRANPSADAGDIRSRATTKLRNVEEKIKELKRIRDALESLIAACPGRGALETCSIIEILDGNDGSPAVSTAGKKR